MPKHKNDTNVQVLLSGGLDSSACVSFYQQQSFIVSATFIDYGQASARCEFEAAQAVAKHYSIPLAIVRCDGMRRKGAGMVQGRNAFLVFSAIMESPEFAGIIALGIHASPHYPDCSAAFVESVQAVVDIYADGRIRIAAPFIDWIKRDIWSFCNSSGVPTNLVYSCEYGGNRPCGRCLSCRDLEMFRACSNA